MPAIPELRDYLLSRRSVTMPFLNDPGPGEAELRQLFTIASRVPDHGKLAPWRLIVFTGEARRQAGGELARIARDQNPDITEEMLDIERDRFLPAPLTIGVVSVQTDHPKIPRFEQLLSAGNVAFNLVHGAHALGYAAQWVTRWFAYDEQAARALGARPGEKFVGFVHIGTPATRLEERDRPPLEDIVSYWPG